MGVTSCLVARIPVRRHLPEQLVREGKTDSKTLALRGFVFDEVGTTCRAVFDHLRAEQDNGAAFDVAEVVRLCSVLRYRDEAPAEVVAASLSIQDTTMRRSTSLTRATLADPPKENDLIQVGREVFMHAVQADRRHAKTHGPGVDRRAVVAGLDGRDDRDRRDELTSPPSRFV